MVKQLVATKMNTARSLYYWLSSTKQEYIHLSAISCPKLSTCYHTHTFLATSQKYAITEINKNCYYMRIEQNRIYLHPIDPSQT